MYFDPMYFVFLLPALLLGLWAQFKVKSAYKHASEMAPATRVSGEEVARRILASEGISGVAIEQVSGFLSDHYDPSKKVLRLSPDVFSGRNLAAVGIAAHEAGHAIQDAKRYSPLVVRNAIVPLASFGSNGAFIFMLMGALLGSFNLILLGIGLFSLIVVFQLVNLPVEFDASKRAKEVLVSRGFISPMEQKEVSKVLDAAALTYVAATITAILTLVYYLWRFGLIGGGRRE